MPFKVQVFLQSCNAPETLRELLAHMGVSVVTTTINSAIKSLSKQADVAIRHLGQSLLVSYAYNNLDVENSKACLIPKNYGRSVDII
jgi:hypothetical protein